MGRKGGKGAKKEEAVEVLAGPSSCSADAGEATSDQVQQGTLGRALRERMYFLALVGGDDENAQASFLLTGQTGKLYTVRLPTRQGGRARCNCPDHLIRKRACKHLLFIAHRVLKLPYDAEELEQERLANLVEQAGAIREAIGKLRPDRGVRAPASVQRAFEAAVPVHLLKPARSARIEHEDPTPEKKRRPVANGDECPICFEEFTDSDAILFCVQGCGHGVHDGCMRRYSAAVTTAYDDDVRCPLCRAAWHFPEDVAGHPKNVDGDRIPSRGVLSGGLLIDLSTMARGAFTEPRGSRGTRGRDDDSHDDDGDAADLDCTGGRGCESVGEKRARQKDERAERAMRRAGRLQELDDNGAVEAPTRRKRASAGRKADDTMRVTPKRARRVRN